MLREAHLCQLSLPVEPAARWGVRTVTSRDEEVNDGARGGHWFRCRIRWCRSHRRSSHPCSHTSPNLPPSRTPQGWLPTAACDIVSRVRICFIVLVTQANTRVTQAIENQNWWTCKRSSFIMQCLRTRRHNISAMHMLVTQATNRAKV